MLGHGAIGQFAIGQIGAGTAETITVDKWFEWLSEPVRTLAGLRAPQQAAFFYQPAPSPFVATGWFEALAEPVRARPRSPAALSPFFSFDPIPLVSFSWFDLLSEPVRTKPGLKPPQQQFFTTDTAVIPLTTGLVPWYARLAEPVRKLSGLDAARQQFLAAPSRLIPTPSISGIMHALETKDVFLAGATEFNQAASAEIGIVDTSFPAAEIGVSRVAVATVSISISII